MLAAGTVVAMAAYRGQDGGPGGVHAGLSSRCLRRSRRCRSPGRWRRDSATSRPGGRWPTWPSSPPAWPWPAWHRAPRRSSSAACRSAAVAVGLLRARFTGLAGHPCGERGLEPDRSALPVLERGGHHGRAGGARPALARLPPHRQRGPPGAGVPGARSSASSPSCSPSRAGRWPPPAMVAITWFALVPLRLRSLPGAAGAGRARRGGLAPGPCRRMRSRRRSSRSRPGRAWPGTSGCCCC